MDINIDPDFLSRLNKKFLKYENTIQRDLLLKMKIGTDLVYRIARARRPKLKGKNGKKLVSDPSADYGVPVRTGVLQASIQKEVKTEGVNKVVGRIFSDVDYSKYVEFGTSKMRARPFMRPAIKLNEENLRKIFKTAPKNTNKNA